MQTTVFRISLSTKHAFQLGTRALIVFAFLLVPIAVFNSLDASQHADDLAMLDSLSIQPARILLVLFLVALAWILTMIVANVCAIRPSGNFMMLEESDLTYVRLGIRQRWAWRTLPEFSITVHPDGARVIEFRPPKAGGWQAYLGSWVVWLAGGWFARGWRIIRISNQYDTPLQEMVDRLNEYRERALGGGTTTGGPRTSEPA